MMQPLLAQSPLSLLKQVAKFAERRQEVLAGNIANVDTPGYRMKDLPTKEFQAALRDALVPNRNRGKDQSSAGVPWSLDPAHSTSGNITPGDAMESLFPDQLFQAREADTQPGITFQDANNRSIEHQFLEMTKNSMMQNFALQVMSAQYSQLQAAITGQT